MRTILLIEQDREHLDSLAVTIRQWWPDSKILTAMDETVARQLLSNHPVDVILCSLNLPQTEDLPALSYLTEQYAHIPLISICDGSGDIENKALKLGACYHHERPCNQMLLFDQLHELFEVSTGGFVRGIPIHSFLQMLEGDGKTCTLQCALGDEIGFIYMVEGVLVDGRCGDLSGEEALYEMIGWDDAIIRIRYFNGKKKDSIKKPLMSIIMEGMRRKDERLHGEGEKRGNKRQPRLKRFLTAGHRLSLDIGASLTMEFDNIDTPLRAMMIGMVPGSHLIVTTPDHFSVTKTQPQEKIGLLVKYLHMGNLCLFKTDLLRSIEYPQKHLFLRYPTIIHYHELRQAKRVAIYINCRILLPDGSQFDGALVDLSYSGGLVQVLASTNSELPQVQIREPVKINCMLPGLDNEQEISGIVRNLQKNSQEARIGMEFKNLRSSIQNTINHYLDSIEKIQV